MRKSKSKANIGEFRMLINEEDFNNEYDFCFTTGIITEKMGVYLLNIAENIGRKYITTNSRFVIEEMKSKILLDVLERFFVINVNGSPLATFVVVMLNRSKNFFRDINNGNIDIYGARIGFGRGSRWIKKEYRKIKFVNYGSIEDFENIH